ncbi:MAG: hypothetical protein M1813_003081 [Trichoglossum hirsutum]|nr:MAG: hypothetical protein M1813_003081 [Trichoglossum hirsutum]
MADEILEKAKDVLDGQIDFEGQRLADFLTTTLLFVSGALAFVVGIVMQEIYLTTYIGLGGAALTFLIVLPPWPFFNQNPIRWLPPQGGTSRSKGVLGATGIEVDGKKVV